MRTYALAAATMALIVAGCSVKKEEAEQEAAAPGPAAEASVAPKAGPTVPGFDIAGVPLADEPTNLGAFPYFSLIDGYTAMTRENFNGDRRMEHVRDAKFDRFEFFDGFKMIPVEGQLSTRYARGEGASWVEMKRTYEKLIHDLGGVTVWDGSAQQITDRELKFADPRHRGVNWLEKETGAVYMVRTPTREIWVEVWQPWDNPNYFLTVVEKQTMAMRAGLIPAEQLKLALDAEGHVAVPVLFDTDRATLKDESDPVLDEIVKLLNAHKDLKLRVEGHTDTQGSPAHNLQLSDGRAKAVVAALVARGIPASRLTPKGFGQTRPVADNDSESGRARNRRVELVKI